MHLLSLSGWRSTLYTALLLLSSTPAARSHSASTTYSHLVPSAPLYSSGAFLYPNGPTQVFISGAYLNISWEATLFNSYNLYLIRGQDYTQPISLQANYYNLWYYWQVDGGDDLSKPFLFRVVNANGTEIAQATGGFQSEQFWIAPASGSSATPTSSLSSTTLQHATAAGTAATSGVVPSTTETASKTGSASATKTGTSGGGLSVGAEVGVGVGIGVGVTAALLVGAFFLWRRHQRKKERDVQRPPPQPSSQQHYNNAPPPMSSFGRPQPPSHYGSDHSSMWGDRQSMQQWPSPGPQPPMAYAYEMPQNNIKSPAEMQGSAWSEPHELSGDRHTPDGRKSPRAVPSIQPWSGRLPPDHQ